MSFARRFAEVVRSEPVDVVTALTLIAGQAGGDADPVPVLVELDRLATLATARLDDGLPPATLISSVLAGEGFRGTDADYESVESSLLPDVLRRRSGLPILLGVVWVEVARRVGIRASCLATPGHVLVDLAGVILDPFAGGREVTLHAGPAAAPALDGAPLLLRVLANLRALGTRRFDLELCQWTLDFSLLLPSHPLELRRERARLMVRRGHHLQGARELEAFAELAVEPESTGARREAAMARARLN